MSDHFDTCPDQLSTDQLQQYVMYLVEHRSWSLVKIARNALQRFYQYVLGKPCKLSYQVCFLTTYSLGLRLSESLNLTIADVDSHLMRVHVRCGKGRKDRFVPLLLMTLKALRRYWTTHRHPDLLFPGGQPPFEGGESRIMARAGDHRPLHPNDP